MCPGPSLLPTSCSTMYQHTCYALYHSIGELHNIICLLSSLKNMVKSSNIIWLQAIYGDCTRFIEDARQSMMSRLVVVQKDGEGNLYHFFFV